MGVLAKGISYGPPVLRDATADSSLLPELQTRIEEKRDTIDVVPGEGSVLGVWGYLGVLYAFRNKSGGASAGMYKATSTGWTEIDLASGTVVAYLGN